MIERTLVAGDIQYLEFILKDVDLVTGSVSVHNLSYADTITFRLRKYGETINTIEANCEVVSASEGKCRVLVTIPTEIGSYHGEVEVVEGQNVITWKGLYYRIVRQLG